MDTPALISDLAFWKPDVMDDITLGVTIDPQVVTWASLVDSRHLKSLGFNSEAKYTLPTQRDICSKMEEVVDCIDEYGILTSVYSQKGKPFDFHATKGRVSELPGCLRSMFMKDLRELDLSSAQHRIHEIVVKHWLREEYERVPWFWKEVKDKRTRYKFAQELKITEEEAKEHLNSIWNSFEPRKGIPDDSDFRDFEKAAWRIRDKLIEIPALAFAREAAITDHKDDTRRIRGSFMSRVYAFVMRKTMMAVREELGEAMATLNHDGSYIDSEESDDSLIAKAEHASCRLLGDPLMWAIKRPDFRLKVSGTNTYTDIDISKLINLDEYNEDAIQTPDFETHEQRIDPQDVARRLGDTLTMLHRTRMKKAKREDRIAEAMEKAFKALNARYKLVDDCYIDTQIEYPRQGFKMISLNKFSKVLKCATVEYGKKGGSRDFNLISKFEAWNRQERYEKLCFHPTITPERHFNTWTPFEAEQMPPLQKEQRNEITHRLVRLFNHIKYLSGERPYDFMMIILWVANMIQHPEVKSLCLVLLSAEGVGKSMLTRLIQKMIGKTKTLRTSSPENNVWGKFNSLMIGKFLVELAEISKANMHHQYEKVLNILEDDSFPVECKGVDGFEIDSLHHFILNSNNLSAVPPGRRWLLIRSSDKYAANIDCKRCAKLMLETNGEEILCEACQELGGYHAENNKAFDDLCAKALYEFSMSLEGVPEKLTSTHVRENKATAHVKEAAKDSIDAFLERWLTTEYKQYFENHPESLPENVWIDPIELHRMYKTMMRDEKEPLDESSFKSRLGRKKLKGIDKKRRRIQGTSYQPHHYFVNVRMLIDELDLAGETCGTESVLIEVEEIRKKLEHLQACKQMICSGKDPVNGTIFKGDAAVVNVEVRGYDAQIKEYQNKLQSINIDARLAEEEVEDTNIEAGTFVPKVWSDFYNDVEKRVSDFLNAHFGESEMDAVGAGEAIGLESKAVGMEDVTVGIAKEGMAEEMENLKRKRKAETDAKLAEIGFSEDRFDTDGNLKSYAFTVPNKRR